MKNRPEVTGNFSALLVRWKWGPMRPQSRSTLSSAGPALPARAGILAALTREKGGTRQERATCCGTQSQDGNEEELRVAQHKGFVNWEVFEYVK